MRSDDEVRKLADLLERIVGFISDYGREEDMDKDWEYACSVADALDWVLGRIKSTDRFLSDAYLNLDKLMAIVRRIEKETGVKFEDYR